MPPRKRTAKKSTAPLRPVGKDEKAPAKKPPATILAATETGDPMDVLVAMRRRLAKAIDDPNCPPRDLAALTRRLDQVNAQIEELKSRNGDDPIGEAADTPDEPFDAGAV